MAIIAAQLALGTTLCYFEANAATGFVDISIAEEFPRRLPSEVGGGVELSREFPGFRPHFLRGGPGGECLLVEEGRRVNWLRPSTWFCAFPGQCLTEKSYSSSAADQRWRSVDPVRIILSHCKA